jgi:hypothetical protein
MCSLNIPIAVLDFIDRARRHCLWRGFDANAKGKSLAAWPKVGKPKDNGGLGIIDLRSQNEALLLKHLDKFYNKRDIPWVNMIWYSHYSQGHIPHASAEKGSFWWKDLLHLCDKFRGVASCIVGNGSTVLFWLDVWNELYLQEKLPRLFTFAKNQKISVAEFLSEPNLASCLYQNKHMRSIMNYRKLYRIYKLELRRKTSGIIFGGQRNIQPRITSICTDTFSLQRLSYGFGVLDVATSRDFSHGYY